MDAQWIFLVFLLVSLLATYRFEAAPTQVTIHDQRKQF
jgi:hypothetical protein